MQTRELPALNHEDLLRLLRLLLPKDLTANSTMFDVGYEAMKRDFSRALGRQMNLELESNPARSLLQQLRTATE